MDYIWIIYGLSYKKTRPKPGFKQAKLWLAISRRDLIDGIVRHNGKVEQENRV